MMTFDEWLETTLALQRRSYGIDPPALTPEERAEYVRWNMLACHDELHEALQEVGWKPWAGSRHFNRDAFVGELVDTLHFVANMLVMAGCTGDELTMRYRAKQRRNAERQAEGYDGVTGKCPSCRRDLQEVGLTKWRTEDGTLYCSDRCAQLELDFAGS